MLRIFVDLRCLQDPGYAFRGVGCYAASLLRHAKQCLAKELGGAAPRLIALLDGTMDDLPGDYRELVDDVQYSTVPNLVRDTAILLQPSPMTHDQSRLAPMLGRSRVFSCTLVHDFIPLDHPERYLTTPESRRDYLENLIWLGLHDLYVSNSEYSAQRLQEVLGVGGDRIQVTGVGIRSAFEPLEASSTSRSEGPEATAPDRYFLVVGGGDPRKNVESPIIALGKLLTADRSKARLLVIGRYPGSEVKRLHDLFRRHGGRDDQIEFVSGLSDRALAVLYRKALATVCPSRVEGFSIPVVEAIASGCPVLAANCEAQVELVPQDDALFDPDDHDRLKGLMARLLHEPGWREDLLERQRGIVPRFLEPVVAERFWTRLISDYEAWRSSRPVRLPKSKPRLAVLTPYPPDRSGVAIYTAESLRSLARHATIDVFSDAEGIVPDPSVRSFQPLSDLPFAVDEYDRIVTVVGNSHFHTRIIDYHCRHGSACIAHDNRLAELYAWWRGAEAFAAMASQSLGRAVSVAESQEWLRHPHRLPSIFFDEILPKSDPLIVHSRGIKARVSEQYGVDAACLPFCSYDVPEDSDLEENARQEARRRLGLPADQVVIVTFGIVSPVKGSIECLWALEQLQAWGIPAHLYFVGEAGGARSHLADWTAKLGLSGSVHLMQEWVSDRAYRDFLLAADLAIQLRKHFFGGLSGALLDCIGAGLPTVANRDLAEAVEAPDFVLRVPDQLSATLIAERLADGLAAGLHRRRLTEARSAYLAEHSFDRYAALMMKVLALGS